MSQKKTHQLSLPVPDTATKVIFESKEVRFVDVQRLLTAVLPVGWVSKIRVLITCIGTYIINAEGQVQAECTLAADHVGATWVAP